MQHKILKKLGIAILLIGAYTAPSYAGGSSWEVLVERVETQSQTSATLYLRQIDNKTKWYPKCSKLTIFADYKPGNIFSRQIPVNQAEHVTALQYLKQANFNRQTIRFGEIGNGLVSPQTSEGWLSELLKLFSFWQSNRIKTNDLAKQQNCTFKTRGLKIFYEYNGMLGVYSFYHY
ncbi:MAG TPA: hypothetical protein V6D25_26510 [Leptolyngbyaceae cyanobacterium]